MKIKLIETLLLILILGLSSCDNSIPASEVAIPTIDEIKNDILNKKLDSWTFDKLEEFKSVEITNTKIIDELNIELEVSVELIDYITGKTYQGNLVINYSRMGESIKGWLFQDVKGTVTKVYNEDAVATEYNSDSEQNKSNYRDEFDNAVKEAAEEALVEAIVETVSGKSQNQSNSYPICDWCGEEIKGNIYHANYHGSPYGNDWYVSSNSGKGPFHQNCAYKFCESKK